MSATGRADPPRSGGSLPNRLGAAWGRLPGERRLAALACLGLFLSLFLPWYQETVIARGVTSLHQLSETFTGWGAFSFVEAAVLLVVAGVLSLLFLRADGRAFHVPGGDGGVVTAAGAWTCILLIWRMFDKQGETGYRQYATTSGVEWGIFIALIIAGVLTYAGTRIRLAHDPEPPLPGGEQYLGPGAAERPARRGWRRRGARRAPRADRAPGRTVPSREPARPAAREPVRPERGLDPRPERRPDRRPERGPQGRPRPARDWSSDGDGDWSAAPPTRRVRPQSIGDPTADPATEPLVQRVGSEPDPAPSTRTTADPAAEELTTRLDGD